MLVVQKFGGATLSDPQKIRAVAQRIANESKAGKKLVVVVSAMGSSTNELIALAKQISPNPHLREMDMLLSVGERISMSLLSMALNDLGVKALSLTGSQAGVLTNDFHSNAMIIDIKSSRLEEALQKSSVVVLAGFQGVSPKTKEITTLGRGGSDTTALAVAAYLKADHCEILKDVSSIFSADPRLVPQAHPLQRLSYEQLAEMTFWGAKVMHHRSAELAYHSKIPVYIGPAHAYADGTWVKDFSEKKEVTMYENPKILSINSHEKVLSLQIKKPDLASALKKLETDLETAQIGLPQILSIETKPESIQIWITAPTETMQGIELWLSKQTDWSPSTNQEWSTVTATCSGSSAWPLLQNCLEKLKQKKISVEHLRCTSLSLSFFIAAKDRLAAIQALHDPAMS